MVGPEPLNALSVIAVIVVAAFRLWLRQLDDLADRVPWMCGGKAHVAGGVPVLRGHDGQALAGKVGDHLVDDGDDFVAARNGQRAAGAEVVLDVDDEQRLHL